VAGLERIEKPVERGPVGGWGESDAQRPGGARGVVAGLGEEAVQRREDRDEVTAKFVPGGGKADPAAGALEQPGADACLQAADSLADTRLGDLQPLGGPLLEAVSYLLAPHLARVPAWGRPLISAAVLIPLMQYAVMPGLTRAARGFLYPRQLPAAPDDAP
jgi:hypothetical protein